MSQIAKLSKPHLSCDERIRRSKCLNIGVICINEMGHFYPVMHISEELASRGHKVNVIVYDYNKERVMELLGRLKGVTPHEMHDGFSKDDLFKRAQKDKKFAKVMN